MARISPLKEEDASKEQRDAIEHELQARGRMTNLKWIQAHSPAALRIYGEWFTLKAELSHRLGDRSILLFCLAISQAQAAAIPVGFFRRALSAIRVEPHLSPLTTEEQLLQKLGDTIGRGAGGISETQWAELRAIFDEVTLVNLSAFAGMMVATTTFANIVQAAPDEDILPFLEDWKTPVSDPSRQ